MTRPRCSALLVGLIALAGCGGGHQAAPAPTVTTTAPAAPAASATVDPAVAVAKRRDALRAEIGALRQLKPNTVQSLFYKLDGFALDLGTQHLKAGTHLIDQQLATNLDYGPRYDEFERRIERQEWAKLVPTWQRYIRKLEAAKIHGGPIARSTRDFQAGEWRRSVAIMKEYLAYLRRGPTDNTHDDYYQPLANQQASRWPVVIAVPALRKQRLLKGLRRDLGRLQGVDALDDRSPSVGDVYRREIVASFVSPLKKGFKQKREQTVAAQQWMLFRLAQLEHTPRDVYETARSTIALQGLQESRNPYDVLLHVGLAVKDEYLSKPSDLREARNTRTWALRLLARPVPPILEQTRAQLEDVYRGLDLSEPKGRFGLYDMSKPFERAGESVVPILRRGAKLVDSPRKLRAATVRTVVATRPDV